MSNQSKPSIVFVHGIWADGSSFGKLIPTLQAEGHDVIAAQYGLDTLAGDVAAVKSTLARVGGPVILVGHSYGGTLITAAGTDPRVAGLLYIAALAPDADETSQSQQDKFPVTDVFSHIEVADGRVWMKPDGVVCFAGDLSQEEQKLVWATHAAPAADLFTQKVEGTAWRSKPSWNASSQSAWAPPSLRPTAAMSPCCPSPTSCLMSSARPQTRFKKVSQRNGCCGRLQVFWRDRRETVSLCDSS
jgi:pimeloyl-ACP methyl ester carboxylesterase